MRARLTIFLLYITSAMGLAIAKQPQWIWVETEVKNQKAIFKTTFDVKSEVTAAWLSCVGESTHLSIDLDGTDICSLEAYDPMVRIDVTESIRQGKQTIKARCNGVEGPSAFFVQLTLKTRDGLRQIITTDNSWKCTTETAKPTTMSFGSVDPRLTIPTDRGIDLAAVDNYQQWKHALSSEQGTDPASFVTTPGFEIQLVRSAKDDEDSWVSLAVDPKGRLIIAKEKVGLLRMELSSDGSSVTSVETIDQTLKECRGLAFVDNTLFANANNSKALYRLKPDGNDGFQKPEVVFASTGGVGHGRNDITVGPDRMIYAIHGDSVDLPINATDLTSPVRDAAFGEPRNEGHLLRIDPGTGEATILAAGLRNPFGIDFNAHGDIFTYDADAEYDMGSPWYRPTRVSHLVTGADYGWRAVTKSWPSYYPDHPDNGIPNFDVGKGSPTAVKFGTRSNFPKRYRDALFILDWTYGRIIAVHTIPRGASYLVTAETFLKGRPLNVTDLDFAPDGSMYFVTGGRKTQSALYRVRFVGKTTNATAQTEQQQRRAKFATGSRQLRHSLERQLSQTETTSATQLLSHLSNDDPWIRHAARNLLERRRKDDWKSIALNEESVETVLQASLSIARGLRFDEDEKIRQAAFTALGRIDLTKLRRSQKQTALYAYDLLTQSSEASEPSVSAAADHVASIYPDRSYLVNRRASELLCSLETS